jgi:hypothetical protein
VLPSCFIIECRYIFQKIKSLQQQLRAGIPCPKINQDLTTVQNNLFSLYAQTSAVVIITPEKLYMCCTERSDLTWTKCGLGSKLRYQMLEWNVVQVELHGQLRCQMLQWMWTKDELSSKLRCQMQQWPRVSK